jgi:hypothetical protein
MKLLKVLASLGMASIFAIPLCFGSSFTKPSSAVSDAAYSANWDGVTGTGASKNALYDVISTLGGGHDEVTVNTTAAYLLSVSGQDLRTNTTRTGLWDAAYAYGNHATAGYLTSYTEGDYVFGNSAAVNVTNSGISNWNTAYSWGNHAIAGYLTTFSESDPVFSAAAAVNVTTSGIANWNTAYAYGNHQAAGYLTAFTESDPIYAASNAANLTLIGHWNTAYAYGNHATVGYLTAYTEGDYVYGNSAAVNVTNASIANWNTAYAYGNHAAQNYLDKDTDTYVASESDPVFIVHAASNVTNSGIANWNITYAYGNHQAAGYLKNLVEDTTPQLGANLDLNSFYITGLVIGADVQAYDSDLTDIADKTTTGQYTFGNVVVDDEAYSASGWDAITNVPTKNAIRDKIEALPGGHAAVTLNANADFLLALSTQELTVNTTRTGLWDLAYAWGNHATVGYLTSYTEGDYVYGNAAASNVTNSGIANWNTAFSWGNHAAVGYVEDESDPVYAASNAANLTLIGYWNAAYAYGNHAAVGYLTTFNELDPDFDASVAANIDALDVGNWDLAVTWGNHAAVGYVEDESDPVYAASNAANLTLIGYWNTAYAYGNHATAGYLKAITATEVTSNAYGNIVATNVQEAIEELDREKSLGTHDHSGTYEPAGVTGFEVTITPAGNIASGNVGYALNELDMEKATVVHAHDAAYAPRQQFVSRTLLSPTSLDDYLVFKAPYSITIQSVNCITDPADVGESVVLSIQECNSSGDGCATMDAAITCTSTGAADDGSLADAIVASGGWLMAEIGTVTGNATVRALTYTVAYNAT